MNFPKLDWKTKVNITLTID